MKTPMVAALPESDIDFAVGVNRGNRPESSLLAELKSLLIRGDLPPALAGPADICIKTTYVPMRDGTRLATDLYVPLVRPAPVVVTRTPYGKARDINVAAFMAFARRGYLVVSQDCRGTGDSEPDTWDYYMYEADDGFDCIEWITQQPWYGGFIGSVGASYVGQTQWCMAMHPAMSTIVPTVSGLGFGSNTAHLYMYLNAYARTIGKGPDKQSIPSHEMERAFEAETLSGGFFNEPLVKALPASLRSKFPKLGELSSSQAQRWLWGHYCSLSSFERATFIRDAMGVPQVTATEVETISTIFGPQVAHDAFSIPHSDQNELCRELQAPALIWTGWYDWALNDAFSTWKMIREAARPEVAKRTRLVITPCAHNMAGYHEGFEQHPELARINSTWNQQAVLLKWYQSIRDGNTDTWPTVLYYLMGANEWRVGDDWPIPGAHECALYLRDDGSLSADPPKTATPPASYTYDPMNPTPTVGGSILSYVFTPGSVDVSLTQARGDILVYTSEALQQSLDVVGPVRMILYAKSSAVDTDFVVRLTDVFPDGRAVQIQSGILRARYRELGGEPELLDPNRIYRLEIDLWHTANRFKAGHRLRVDISSADFPHFDRHSNCAGECDGPIAAQQSIYHDAEHPSHMKLFVLDSSEPGLQVDRDQHAA